MKRKTETVAVVTIHGAGEMTKMGKMRIALWLRGCADDLVEEGHNYSPLFRARYIAVRKGKP